LNIATDARFYRRSRARRSTIKEKIMKVRLVGCAVLAFLSLGLVACGDDDDGGDGGGCANAQMLCADDDTVEIDCADFGSAPASVRECVGNATTCDAVGACLFSSSPVAGSGG
jgi:hypothetical protein